MTDFAKLSEFKLQSGAHTDPADGLCAMEAVAWLEGLEHSDKPECTCPVIAAYVRRINDRLPYEERQRLVAYLPKLVGTVSSEHERERANFLAWQSVRVFAPMALRSAGLNDCATKLEAQTNLSVALGFCRDAKAAAAADAAAAAYAAAAADAAADAAAAAAADAAAYAAAAVAADAYAAVARRPVWDAMFTALDGVLNIGPSGKPFAREIDEAVSAYRDLVTA